MGDRYLKEVEPGDAYKKELEIRAEQTVKNNTGILVSIFRALVMLAATFFAATLVAFTAMLFGIRYTGAEFVDTTILVIIASVLVATFAKISSLAERLAKK
jgi:hypothetical protein